MSAKITNPFGESVPPAPPAIPSPSTWAAGGTLSSDTPPTLPPSWPSSRTRIRTFIVKGRFYAVVFPLDQRSVVNGFWTSPSAAVSSRFAEANLAHVDSLREVPIKTVVDEDNEDERTSFGGPAHQILRERIASHVNRAPLNPQQRPSSTDVYLDQTGMASIYKPHIYMLERFPGTTVLFGTAFMNTITVFDEFGPGSRFFGNGSDADLVALEAFLHEERAQGRKVQAIWADVELEDLETTRAFYDGLNVHKSVHLGAPFTLAFAYTACAYGKAQDWAEGLGLRPTQVRLSAKLEDTPHASGRLQGRVAVETADHVKRGRLSVGKSA